MAYIPSRLARITPGEVSPDQAVIDYFYYAPNVPIKTIMSKGFFDGAGYLFYNSNNSRTYQRISIYALKGNLGDPSCERYSAVVSDVTPTSGPSQIPPNKFEVTVSLGADTSYSYDDTVVPPPIIESWHNFFIKYQGIVRYTSNYLPGTPAFIDIPSQYAYGASDFSTAVLLSAPGNPNQPVAGDAIVASYVEPGPSTAFPLRVRLINPSNGGGFNQRAWVTIYSATCKFL